MVSRASAALLHELPLLDAPPARVQVTRPDARAGKDRGNVHLHAAGLAPEDRVLLGDVWPTSPAGTVVDLARSERLESAVARATPHWHGSAGGLCSTGCSSAGESLSRLLLRDLPVPDPELQLTIHHERGRAVARCDFGWPELGVVAEFDGRVKYGRTLTPDRYVGDVLFDEKVREDLVRDLGWEVVRWIWPT